MSSLIFYDKFLANQNNGTAVVDFDSDTIRVCLCTAFGSATASDFYDDVTELANGDGYTTKGEVSTITPSTATAGQYNLDASDTTWTFTATKTFQYAVVYKDTHTAGTSPLIAYSDLGAQSVAGVFNLNLADAYLIRFAK